MDDAHKEQDRYTTFGRNPMGETSTCLLRFFWRTMDMYFTVQYRIPCISMQRRYI